jgi:predicted nucleic-acid-binding protein
MLSKLFAGIMILCCIYGEAQTPYAWVLQNNTMASREDIYNVVELSNGKLVFCGVRGQVTSTIIPYTKL